MVGHTSDWITTTVAIVNQTKYYFLGGRRVAMRQGDKVFYLYGDHLGSMSLATDENGDVTYDARYLPYGGGRWSDGVSPTDFGFTDQRQESGLGLHDYNARYFDPFLGRFISPDTIVPEPENPQTWNRYSYANNNPVKYIDPSGHAPPPPDDDQEIAAYFSGVALGLDTLSMVSNGVGALITDVAGIVAGPPGYGGGVIVHNAVISPLAMGLDGLGVIATTVSGVFTGENAIIYESDQNSVSVTFKISQDTIIATSLFVLGGVSPDPNLDTGISAGGVAYDLGRLDEEGLHNLCCDSVPYNDNFPYDIPTMINPSITIILYENKDDTDSQEEQEPLTPQKEYKK